MTRPSALLAALLTSSAHFSLASDQAVLDLIQRVTPELAPNIHLGNIESNNGEETFVLGSENNTLTIAGSSSSAKAAGFGWYLKHVTNSQLSWGGDQLTNKLVLPKKSIQQTTPYRYRFAYNYCTLSYTMAFWDWQRWEREIDQLSMQGYTHALVTAGLEKVWQLTLRELNYPDSEIKKFIPNPAFAAWWNMGNLEGHGGPLTQNLIDGEAQLGRQIATRMRELEITPTLQGFVGFLPHNIAEYNKELKLVPQGKWVGFQRPIVLDPTSEAFQEVAAIWYKNLHKVYGGKSNAYGGDLFHEGGRHGKIDVTAAAKAVQASMQAASPGSTWVLQCWHNNPSPALIRGTDPNKTFILQLCRNMKDGNNGGRLRTFQDRPWLYSELANFGGNHNLYGGNKLAASLPSRFLDPTKNLGNMAGLALLSEGVETNPLYYAIFHDAFWRKQDIDLDSWIPNYAQRRYGLKHPDAIEALFTLNNSVYNPTGIQEGCTESILCAKPNRNARKASTWSGTHVYYKPLDVVDAAESLLKAAPKLGEEATYRYDLTDVTRQVLADLARPTLTAAMDAYDLGDVKEFKKYSRLYLDLLSDTDTLLAADQHWLLGTWIERAKAKGKTAKEKRIMEVAARRQITTWSNKADSLDEYAHRQWAGLMADYYHPRWRSFFLTHLDVLEKRKPSKSLNSWYRDQRMQEDINWSLETKKYPTKATGDTIAIAQEILKKYAPTARKFDKEKSKTIGLPWKLTQADELFSFDVNEHILSTGTYLVTLQYKRGSSALKTHSVALYEGDKKVAEDAHEGWTGVENRENNYRIDLKKLRTNLDSYSLRVKASSVSSIDSSGVMKIKKVQ